MEYSSIVEELEGMYFELEKLSTLDTNNIYKPQKVEWTGLIGAAQGYLKERKVNNFLEKSLLGTNFLNVPGFLIQRADKMAKVFSESDNNNGSVEFAEKIVKLIEDCFSLWQSKCPGIENALIDDDIAKGVPLPLGVTSQYYLYHSFQKYPLDEATKKRVAEKVDFLEWRVKRLKEKENQNSSSSSSSGCLGIILLFVLSSCILVSCSLFI